MSTRRRVGVWKRCLAGSAAVVLFAYLIILALNGMTNMKWRRYVAELRARGEPVTIADVESRRTVLSDDENGAGVIQGLYHKLHEVKATHANRSTLEFVTREPKHDFFTGFPYYEVPRIRAFVESLAGLLTDLDELRDKPCGRFSIAWNLADPFSTDFNHLEPVRVAARLEYLATLARLLEEDLSGAAKHIEILFRVAGTLHDDPSIITRVIQLSVTDRAIRALEGALRVGEFDAETLEFFQCLVEERLETDSIRWALLGERAMLIAFFEAVIKGTVSIQSIMNGYAATGRQGLVLAPPTLPTVVIRQNQLKAARLMTELLQASNDREPLLAAASSVSVQLRALPFVQFITERVFPDQSRAILLHYKSKSRLETARSALAWERFRLAHGTQPESWSDLVPEFLDALPPDWLTDGVVNMRITGHETVFYSLGENQMDDDGEVVNQVGQGGQQWRARDVGFRLLLPEKRGVIILDAPPPEDEE